MRFFGLNWTGQTNPSGLLISHLKYFRLRFRIHPDGWISVHSVYSAHVLFIHFKCHSAYSWSTLKFTQRILTTYTISFHVSVCELFQHSVKQILRIPIIRQVSFRVYQFTCNFISRIRSILTILFSVFLVYVKFIPRILRRRQIKSEHSKWTYFLQ